MKGIGTDIEQVSRFKTNLDNKTFLNKIFLNKELEYCLNKPHPEEH